MKPASRSSSLDCVADTNEQPLTCAECGREPREDENAEDDWRTYYEGVGDGGGDAEAGGCEAGY